MPVPRVLAHLLAADGDEAVHIDAVRHLVARELEHRRPEQHVEVDDVLADEVDLLGVRVGGIRRTNRLAVGRRPAAVEVVFQRGR